MKNRRKLKLKKQKELLQLLRFSGKNLQNSLNVASVFVNLSSFRTKRFFLFKTDWIISHEKKNTYLHNPSKVTPKSIFLPKRYFLSTHKKSDRIILCGKKESNCTFFFLKDNRIWRTRGLVVFCCNIKEKEKDLRKLKVNKFLVLQSSFKNRRRKEYKRSKRKLLKNA